VVFLKNCLRDSELEVFMAVLCDEVNEIRK
jgi:hypothetical protein